MVIKSLKLQNYRRFRTLELEFPENLIGILGRNGMGKTTIVEAIGWALYGTRTARTDKIDIRSQFASETDVCSAEMVFHCAGQEYRIVRQLRGKNAVSEAAIYLNGTGQAEAVQDTGVNQYVENLLKLDYRSFFASVFAKQKDLAALSQMMPEERRKSICRLINIDVIDKARQAVRRDKTEQDGVIKGLETRLKNVPELKVQQRKLQQQLDERLKNEQESLAWLEDIKKRLEEAKKNLETMSQIRDKHQQLVAEIEKLTTRQTDYTRLAQRHQQEIQQIQKARKELETLQPHLIRFSEIKQEKDRLDLESIKQAALDARSQEKERLAGLLKRNTVHLTKLDVDLNALATVRPQLEQVNQQLAQLEAEQTKLRIQKEEVHGQLEAVKSLGLEVKEKKDKVTILGAKGPCPVCTRPLGEHYAHVVTHLEEELKKLRSQYTKFSEQEKEVEQQLTKLEGSLKSAREKRDQLLQAAQKYDHLLSQKKDVTEFIEDLQGQLRDLNQDIAHIGPLKYDAHQHELIKKQFLELTAIHEKAIQYTEQVKRLPLEVEELKKIQETISDLTQRIKQLQQEKESLQFDETQFQNAKEQVEARQTDFDKTRDELNDIRNCITLIQNDIENLKQEIEEQEKLTVDIESAREEVVYLQALEEHLGIFRQELAGRIRPLIAARASELLGLTTNGRYSLIHLDEDYNIFIYDQNQPFPIARFSGGEQDLVNLCLRIAISQIVAERSGGTQINFIVLDEVFGSQDEDRRELILHALQHLSSQFRQIFVITHVEGIKDVLPVVVMVEEKDVSESRAVMV